MPRDCTALSDHSALSDVQSVPSGWIQYTDKPKMTKRNASSSRARSANNRTRRLRGKGDYSEDIRNETNVATRLEKKIDHLERSLVHATPSIAKGASIAGRALGSLLGQGDLGAMAGEGLSKLFGFGDYRVAVKGNSLMAGTTSTPVPKFSGDGRRGTRITEREFIGNVLTGSVVSGSSVFNNAVYPVNPIDSNTFPWLSRIAQQFDQWEPHGIVFEYRTTSSTFNGTSQALGAVIMATDYDSLDAAFRDKQQMENADYACSTVPSQSLLHGLECDPRERPLEVMYTQTRAGNQNFSSLGNFQIATQGCSTAGTTLGELWISYDITFYKKVLPEHSESSPFVNINNKAIALSQLFKPNSATIAKDITVALIPGYGTRFVFPPSQSSGRYLFLAYMSEFLSGDLGQIVPFGHKNCEQVSGYAGTNTGIGTPGVSSSVINITGPGAWFHTGLKQGTPPQEANAKMILIPIDFDTNWDVTPPV
ncbi:putative capsid protein [Changjiang narna-like virus 2]|uniref:putative capsid protein n=1 Tax=Changjiang narna-like virus 2 TaxID=1922777 RepID=UPI00090CA062|nr:putative capsid protein [Changjiang narna-like virus 2]APG77109.1 putative capsid protein [Changjiang narna-like virus 2]